MTMKYKVNFHINEVCNFDCKFCFARTHSNETRCYSSTDTKINIIKALSLSKYVCGINYAGGEPLLDNHIIDYLKLTTELGLKASIVTNGFGLLKDNKLEAILPYLTTLGISYHSFNKETQEKIGFCNSLNESLSFEDLKKICLITKKINPTCEIKINTVVNRYNYKENLKDKMEKLPIDKWKFLFCQTYDNNSECLITKEEFNIFIKNNDTNKIKVVKELKMDDSYIMLNPKGQLKTKHNDNYSYSKSILEVLFDELFTHYNFDPHMYKLNHHE